MVSLPLSAPMMAHTEQPCSGGAAAGHSCPCCVALQEDLILPHHLSFYDLIINKARGKSGPLFDFGVKDDIRMLGDASVESQDVHAGKVGAGGARTGGWDRQLRGGWWCTVVAR